MMGSRERVRVEFTSYSHTRTGASVWLTAWRRPGSLGALAVLLAAAGGLTVRSRDQPPLRPAAEFAVPVAGAEVQELVAQGSVAAVVTRSAMGERLLSVRRLSDGLELLERHPFEGHGIVLSGHQLAFSEETAVILIDLDSRTARTAWRGESDSRPSALCLWRESLTILAPTSEAWTLVNVRTNRTDAGPESRAITSVTPPALSCHPESAIVTVSDPDGRRMAEIVDDAGGSRVALEHYEPLLTHLGFLYARDASGSVFRRPSSGDGEWQQIYTSAESPAAVAASVAPTTGRIALVATTASHGTMLITFAPDGSQPARAPLPADRVWSNARLWSIDGTTVAALGRRDAQSWVFAATFEEPQPAAIAPEAASTRPDATARALAWLDRQLTPRFRTKTGDMGRLIDSYEDEKRVGWTYDAAVAAIALTSWNRTDAARELITGLASLQQDDGSWSFAYDPDVASPLPGDRYVGSMAWAVMATNFYEWRTGDRRFAETAARALAFIDRFVQRDAGQPTAGGVSMGPVAPQTYSAEHNADAYSAFRWRARLTGDAAAAATAEGIRGFMLRELAPDVSARRPFFKVGYRDDTLYLDPQTWTTLALAAPDEPDDRFRGALQCATERLTGSGTLGTLSGVKGFRDWADADVGKVWSEGTEGMVAARLALGDADAARAWHEQTMRLQSAAGGIPYATENRENWTTRPSVAGTAWFLLNRTWPPTNPFVPDAAPWMELFGSGPRVVVER
jgi:hypothetical protein